MIIIFLKNADTAVTYLIPKKIESDEKTCNKCFIVLQKEDKINQFIYVIWRDNTKYRIFSYLHRSYIDYIRRREPLYGKTGKICCEELEMNLNALCNYD